jgi:kynurenine formamidase
MSLTLPRLSASLCNWSTLALLIFVLSHNAIAWSEEPRFIDHSLLIAPEYPCTWPSHPFPRFAIVHQRKIGPESAYNIDSFLIDGNTGTQLDVPPHSVARPELKRENSGPLGLAYTEEIEPWQFSGEACVIDVRNLLDKILSKGAYFLFAAVKVRNCHGGPGRAIIFH